MGHIIEQIALSRGHSIVAKIDAYPFADDVMLPDVGFISDAFMQADVVIEFTTPQTAETNVRRAWQAGKPVVCGSTGWKVEPLIQEANGTGQSLIWTSNFSLGVNILFELNKRLATIIKNYPSYTPSIEETHHIHKLDAPSGTAKTLQEQLLEYSAVASCPIESIRRDEVPGIHTITWDSAVDTISLTHSAKSREGFALGAVLAAEWLPGHKGFHQMNEVLF